MQASVDSPKPNNKKDEKTVHQSVLDDDNDADFGDYSDKIEEIEFKKHDDHE